MDNDKSPNAMKMMITWKENVNRYAKVLKKEYSYVYFVLRNTGCPRMFYTQKCQILRIFITIKTIEFGILIYFSDRAVLLAFLRILNQGNRPNKLKIHDIM